MTHAYCIAARSRRRYTHTYTRNLNLPIDATATLPSNAAINAGIIDVANSCLPELVGL